MKHTINLFLIIAVAGIAMFTACKDEDISDPSSLTIDRTMIEVMPVGGQTLISVNTDLAWNATVDADWVKISPASGNSSETVNVEIDKHLGLRRTAKISFTAGAVSKAVEIQQRGQDTAGYLKGRENRKVKHTYLEGTTAKVTWGAVTEHCVVSELEYETLSGKWRKMTVTPTDSIFECTDAKPGVKYRTRSGFVTPGMVDTLYKSWALSKYPFLSFSTGTYSVHRLSHRYYGASGEPSSPVPQTEYSVPRTVTIESGEEEGQYRISDLFGGFYVPGRDGYNVNDHVCWGILSYDGTNFGLVEAKIDSWGYGWTKVEGTANSTAVTLDTYWNTSDYVFRLILQKEPRPGFDADGYRTVDNLPFRDNGKYEFSAVTWPGQIGAWGEKYGVLAYKVTVNKNGKLKVTDHKSPDYNIWFLLYNDKEAADKGDHKSVTEWDGTIEYDVTPGTYYIFGILNTWYGDIAVLNTIDYDIEITCN
jgi:hypothetical protein